jgi:hypothetical protein
LPLLTRLVLVTLPIMERDEYNERLWDPSQPSTLTDRINARPGGPDALARASARDEKQVIFYRRHPRVYGALARTPLWRRW